MVKMFNFTKQNTYNNQRLQDVYSSPSVITRKYSISFNEIQSYDNNSSSLMLQGQLPANYEAI